MTIVAKSIRKRTDATDAEKWWVVVTAWGYCGMVWRDGAGDSGGTVKSGSAVLVKIIAAQQSVSALCAQIRREFAHAQRQREGFRRKQRSAGGSNRVAMLAQFLQDYYTGGRRGRHFDAAIWTNWRPHLELDGISDFAQGVLRLTTQIPPGRTQSYGELAASLGRPGAARAVGGALAANPFPILIPCHRVLGKSGEMTGFSAPGGVAAKKAMIESEANTGS